MNAPIQAIIPPCFAPVDRFFLPKRPVRLLVEIAMPIYGYQCQACGHEFELIQKMSDAAPTACPACGKPEVRKQLSAAGFQLKGAGWYVTDFKGGAKPAAETKAAPEAKPAADKGGSDSGPKTGSGTS
jgi:putative FmdB family regulatory protein